MSHGAPHISVMPDLIRHPARSDTPSGAKSVPFAPDASTPNGIRDVMPEDRQPCIYIMASDRPGTLYIGVTSNLMRRLAQHRSGALEGFTARHHQTAGLLRTAWRHGASHRAGEALEKRTSRLENRADPDPQSRLARPRSGPWLCAPAGIGAQRIARCRIESGMTKGI